MNDYNAIRPSLILKEYGRNMQNLVAYLRSIPDREKRTEMAYSLIELMKILNPNARDTQENQQKLWDDLYIMSGFDLDIESPFPMPEKSILTKKPNRVGYKTSEVRFKHYGRNVQLLIEKIIEVEDPQEKEDAIVYIGRLMKSFQSAWNRDNVENEVIIKDIEALSRRRLTIEADKVAASNLFESFVKERRPNKPNVSKNKRNNNRRRRSN